MGQAGGSYHSRPEDLEVVFFMMLFEGVSSVLCVAPEVPGKLWMRP